jgi:hypothetical protein
VAAGVASVEFAFPDPIAVAAIHAPAAMAHTMSAYSAKFLVGVMIDNPLCNVVHEEWRDKAYRPLTDRIRRPA